MKGTVCFQCELGSGDRLWDGPPPRLPHVSLLVLSPTWHQPWDRSQPPLSIYLYFFNVYLKERERDRLSMCEPGRSRERRPQRIPSRLRTVRAEPDAPPTEPPRRPSLSAWSLPLTGAKVASRVSPGVG